MIGIVLCTHSEQSFGFKKSVEMIIGEQEDFEVIGFFNGDDQDDLKDHILKITQNFQKKGLVPCVLVDILGGTPFNVSLSALFGENAYVITGVNLPLLLEILIRKNDLANSDVEESLRKILISAKDSMDIFNSKR